MIAVDRFDRTTLLNTVFASAEDAEAVRRQALRSPLRSWRSSVDPAHVDFPVRARRRPGLTREDVAELADLSFSWYTQLESGSPKHRCSPRAVGRIADALRLDEADRAILQILASREAFQSVRLIIERWIRWKAARSEHQGHESWTLS
jgi:transcriptional regulator with XRE-family HTH domain